MRFKKIFLLLSFLWLSAASFAFRAPIFSETGYLELSNQNFGDRPIEDLIEAIKSHDTPYQWVYLGYNQLYKKSGAELFQAFNELSDNLLDIDLSYDALALMSLDDLKLIIPLLSHKSKSLSLAQQVFFDNKTSLELVEIFHLFEGKVETLFFGGDQFGLKTGKELSDIFGALPNNIHTLMFYNTGLGFLSGPELVRAFSKIKPELTMLVLLNENLHLLSAKDMAYAFKMLSQNIDELGIDENGLGKVKSSILKNAFAALNPNLKSISIGYNNFNLYSIQQLMEVFSALPNHLQEITLSCNLKSIQDKNEMSQLLSALPQSVTKVYVDANEIPYEQAKTIESAINENRSLKLKILHWSERASCY